MKILKYELEITEEQSIDTYAIFRALDVQLQYNKIVLWAAVDESSEPAERKIIIYNTGDKVNTKYAYIGSVQTHLVKAAYHVFQN